MQQVVLAFKDALGELTPTLNDAADMMEERLQTQLLSKLGPMMQVYTDTLDTKTGKEVMVIEAYVGNVLSTLRNAQSDIIESAEKQVEKKAVEISDSMKHEMDVEALKNTVAVLEKRSAAADAAA
eukprot:GHVQ01024705.1.p1 GENE.GHVQ01024705.1~~GHVQ01024705.1.p1  ORF type:complete len:146 (+),score=33.80 GHVQ01024705.1:65-439(+)